LKSDTDIGPGPGDKANGFLKDPVSVIFLNPFLEMVEVEALFVEDLVIEGISRLAVEILKPIS
jgi:hypothetical protein